MDKQPNYTFAFNQNDMDKIIDEGHTDICMKDGIWIRVTLCDDEGNIIDKTVNEPI